MPPLGCKRCFSFLAGPLHPALFVRIPNVRFSWSCSSPDLFHPIKSAVRVCPVAQSGSNTRLELGVSEHGHWPCAGGRRLDVHSVSLTFCSSDRRGASPQKETAVAEGTHWPEPHCWARPGATQGAHHAGGPGATPASPTFHCYFRLNEIMLKPLFTHHTDLSFD